MNRFAIFLIACLLASAGVVAEEAPNWAKRDYAATSGQVFVAAGTYISLQHNAFKLEKGANEKNTLHFHVGTSVRSSGYDMELTMTPIDESHTRVVVGVSRSGGKTFSWGSEQKEVKKILDGIDSGLAGKKTEAK